MPSCGSPTSPAVTPSPPRNFIHESSPCLAARPNAIPSPRFVTTLQNSGPKGSSPSSPTPAAINSCRTATSICLVFLKLFERVYAPLTAGLLSPVSADRQIDQQKRSQLDRLYQRVVDDLDALVRAVGLKVA